MTATPTVPELQRVLDLVAQGFDLQDAADAVFIDAPAPKAPTVMVTEFPDGIVIGWQHCAVLNGGCGLHVTLCKCKKGPRELKVFEQWRSGTKVLPESYRPGSETGTTTAVVTSVAPAGAPVSAPEPDGQVTCRDHQGLVDRDDADQNDDKTWTCISCQVSSSTSAPSDV